LRLGVKLIFYEHVITAQPGPEALYIVLPEPVSSKNVRSI
jgi:hypothetical protein